MYVYSTKKEPNVPSFIENWSDLSQMKDRGELAFFKKVSDVTEGTAYIATKFADHVAPQAEQTKPAEKWCMATQSLTIYKNDKGYFTRKCKKVNDEWKALFIPVYFSSDVTPPEGEKNRVAVDLHWSVAGTETLKAVIIIDKIHAEGDLPF